MEEVQEQEQLQPETPRKPHNCGRCAGGFDTEDEYVAHVCPETGFTPADPEHLGAEFMAISEAAQARGSKRVELEEQGVDPEKAKKLTKDIGTEVR